MNELIGRLTILLRKLEGEGRYVSANTASDAIDAILDLQEKAELSNAYASVHLLDPEAQLYAIKKIHEGRDA